MIAAGGIADGRGIAAALAAKGASTQAIILNVMVGISVSTLFTGILLFGLGALKLGQWVRFIPYPVIAGFLAACVSSSRRRGAWCGADLSAGSPCLARLASERKAPMN